MRHCLLLGCVYCMMGLAGQTFGQPVVSEQYARIVVSRPDTTVLRKIQACGIDLHCGSRFTTANGAPALELEVAQSEMAAMEQKGVAFQVTIPDIERFYAGRAAAHLDVARQDLLLAKRRIPSRKSATADCGLREYPVPKHFFLGDYAGFLRYQEILNVLDSMAADYPQLITIRKPVSDSLRTYQDRPVFWVRISADANTENTNKPQVLYTALTHAREPTSAMSMIYFMWYLLENYNSDDAVRKILDHTELYFIPVVNPDGYLWNEEVAPAGGGMWRKNLCDNDHNGIIDSHDGVDLNRNFGYLWGYDDSGSSPDPSQSVYRGTAPFSEPETRMSPGFCVRASLFHCHPRSLIRQ